MRTDRQHRVDIAVAKALQMIWPFIEPESVLKADAGRLVVPRATETELADSIGYHDTAKRLTSIAGESEVQWKLNDLGRAWLAEQ